MGRPTKYNKEIASEICSRIVNGESLRKICKDNHMPVLSTIFYWLANIEGFSDQYAIAKEEQAETLADEIIEIADYSKNDWVETHGDERTKEMYRINGEAIQRARLRVDARKWVAAKLKPKKYGDKVQQEITGADGKDLIIKWQNPEK